MRDVTMTSRSPSFLLSCFVVSSASLLASVSAEFSVGEVIVDNIRRFNFTVDKPEDFELIPAKALGLSLTFPPFHRISFGNGTLPKRLCQLEALDMDISFIPQPLPDAMLRNLVHLRKLTLYHQLHSSVDFNARLNRAPFENLGRLSSLNLPSVGLSELPVGVFSGLPELKLLDLNDNRMTRLEPGTFDSCCLELVSLDLSRNRLTTFDYKSLTGLPFLRQLLLYGNHISSIPKECFHGLTNLTDLNLESNQLERVDAGAFAGLSSLRKLFLDGNRLKDITRDQFEGLPDLIQLGLGHNKIGELSRGAFASLQSLLELSLPSNHIETIESGAFEGLTRLIVLDLEENLITAIVSTTFLGLKNLTKLNLARNRLTEIASESLMSFAPHLVDLNVDENDLTSLPQNVFEGLDSLSGLKLSRNDWNCDCEILWLAEWIRSRSRTFRTENGLSATTCASPPHLQNASLLCIVGRRASTPIGNESNPVDCVVSTQQPPSATDDDADIIATHTETPSVAATTTPPGDDDEMLVVAMWTVFLVLFFAVAVSLILWFHCRHRLTWRPPKVTLPEDVADGPAALVPPTWPRPSLAWPSRHKNCKCLMSV